MGIGNFFGLLPEQYHSAKLYGVELDSVTGRIAKQLYPEANITVDGFERVEGEFDAVMTNPPIRAGKAVIYRMFEDAKAHLAEGGRLFLVIRKQQGAPSALKFLKELYAEAGDCMQKVSA